jgi:hypothetical protein
MYSDGWKAEKNVEYMPILEQGLSLFQTVLSCLVLRR